MSLIRFRPEPHHRARPIRAFFVDIANLKEMKVVGHLNFEPSVISTEGDFVDVSQVEKTGIVYFSSYPLNEDCFEPYKDIHMIDVSNPQKPVKIGVLPRPRRKNAN